MPSVETPVPCYPPTVPVPPRLSTVALLGVMALPVSRGWAACPDAELHIADAERDVQAYYLSDAAQTLDAAVAGFACTGVAPPELVVRLLNARGVIALLQERSDDARAAFAAARAVDASAFDLDYGEDARAAWASAEQDAIGRLVVKGVPPESWVAVDGSRAAAEVELPVGPHLVQVGTEETAWYARVARVEVDATATLTAPPPPLPPPPVLPPEPEPRPLRAAPLLVAGAAGLLSGASAVAALSQNAAMENATTAADVEGAYGRQVGFAVSSYALAGVAVGGVVVFAVR